MTTNYNHVFYNKGLELSSFCIYKNAISFMHILPKQEAIHEYRRLTRTFQQI